MGGGKTSILPDTIAGAKSKELPVRDEDMQVLHVFDSKEKRKWSGRTPTARRVGLKPARPVLLPIIPRLELE